MPDDPISKPPDVTSTPGIKPTGPDTPRLGEGEEAQGQKPFSLEPEAGKAGKATEATQADKPSPMELAREQGEGKRPQFTPEELGGKVNQLQDTLRDTQAKLNDPQITRNFTEDHHQALGRLTEKLNSDMNTIAKNSDGTYAPAKKTSGESALNFVARWIDGSQKTLGGAVQYLSKMQTTNPNPATFLKLQYAVQRATQRGELFASIISSSVSGIKTIMSTQLG